MQKDHDNIKKLLSTGAEQKVKQSKTKVSKSIKEAVKESGPCTFLYLDIYPPENAVPYQDQSTNLHSKSLEWFLNDTRLG